VLLRQGNRIIDTYVDLLNEKGGDDEDSIPYDEWAGDPL
jgi:hypothetical protein